MFSNRILGGLWDFTGLLAINAEYKQGAEVMDEPANDTSNDFDDFIKHLQLLTETNLAITVEQFNLMLSALCDRFTFDHMEAIVDFASNQRGQWEAEYLFSFVDAPNKKAKFEAEGWNDLIKKWIQLLVFNCKINRYVVSWAKGGFYAQESANNNLFRGRQEDVRVVGA